MTVHFIGAGPGAADLITVRGRELLGRCPVCLFAGSLVPGGVLAYCPAGARLVDTAPLDLDAIEREFVAAEAAGVDVARLHSGDLSIYSAVAEQVRRLRARGIGFTLTPGVPAFAGAAAALGVELTVPGVAQSVVLTRVSGRASAVPEGERLEVFAATGATLAVHLAIAQLSEVVGRLTPVLGVDCPVAVGVRVSWAGERLIWATLGTVEAAMAQEGVGRTALVLVGRGLSQEGAESALYRAGYERRFRGE